MLVPEERIETIVDTGLEYRPGAAVKVRLVRRGTTTWVGDDGVAAELAGRPQGWRAAARNLKRELDVNVSRTGAISLPVVAVGPPEDKVVARIGEASLALYQELLDLV